MEELDKKLLEQLCELLNKFPDTINSNGLSWRFGKNEIYFSIFDDTIEVYLRANNDRNSFLCTIDTNADERLFTQIKWKFVDWQNFAKKRVLDELYEVNNYDENAENELLRDPDEC